MVEQMLNYVNGVLLSGGSDVDPLRFGQKTTGKTGGIIPERDEREFYMLHYLLEKTQKPILGVCWEVQVINVALGGTLIQHIPDAGFTGHTLAMYPRQVPSHRVRVEPGTLLHRLVGAGVLPVNSFHHMAVDESAPALQVTARLEDGVIEAVELSKNPDGRFFLGVQWYPEMMAWADSAQQKIVNAFVDSLNSRNKWSISFKMYFA